MSPIWVFTQSPDDPVASELGATTPFWDTSLVQTISKYGTTTLSYVTPQPTWDTILLSNGELFGPIRDTVSLLRTLGDNIRRQSVSPLPSSLEMDSPEYHTTI